MDTSLHILEFEENDNKLFEKFILDLSYNIKTGVKNLIDGHMASSRARHKSINNTNTNTNIDFINNTSKKKKKHNGIKKKDLIIMRQERKKTIQLINSDLEKIGNFHFSILNIYENMKFLQTKEGMIEYKFTIFEKLSNHYKKINPTIIGLYYQLLDVPTQNMNYNKLIKNITKKLKKGDYDMNTYMLLHLGHMLPPLNFWDHNKKTLDDWQLQVLRNVKHNKSSIVLAPTSSGKTFIAIGASLFKKRILYVVPTKPVAYQVASQFMKMKIKYILLTSDNLTSSNGNSNTFNNCNIFIATPEYAEKYLPIMGVKFDYAVYDEIHNIMKENDGHMYENIIKMIDCNFLALSASIGNIEFMREKWMEFNPGREIEIIKYSKRFINLQRHIWNGEEIQKLHPLACIEKDDLEDCNGSYSDFVDKYELPFTPHDIINLYNKIEEHFEELYYESDSEEDDDDVDENDKNDINIYQWKPCKFFSKYSLENKLITLDMAKEYEYFLKDKLKILYKLYPDKTLRMLKSFKVSESSKCNSARKLRKADIYQIFRDLFDNDMGPAIIFNVKVDICYDIFNDLYNEILKRELDEYPYHYDILNFKQKLYLSYKKRSDLFNSKLTEEERYDKMENFRKKELDSYIVLVSEYYQKLLYKIGENKELSDKLRVIQHTNLHEEFTKFLNYPDLGFKDVFKKHKKYCFTRQEPMSGDVIRNIRKEIKRSIGIEIDYESVLFQMLKRGIGIYIDSMPDIYKWIVQKLVSERKLYFVISDRTLCLGIDLPFRSSVLMGYKDSNYFSENDFTQMSGRAGRRGLDDKGNLVFCGPIGALKLMKGKHQNITSNTTKNSDIMHLLPIIGSMRTTAFINNDTFTNEVINRLYLNNLNKDNNIPENIVSNLILNVNNFKKYKINVLYIVWSLRYENYDLLNHFVRQFNLLEKKLYMKGSKNTERYLYHYLCEIFIKKSKYNIIMGNVDDIIEFNKINEGNYLMNVLRDVIIENRIVIDNSTEKTITNAEIAVHLKYLGTVIINIYNELYKDKHYIILCKTLKKLLGVIKHIIFNNIKSIQNK